MKANHKMCIKCKTSSNTIPLIRLLLNLILIHVSFECGLPHKRHFSYVVFLFQHYVKGVHTVLVIKIYKGEIRTIEEC